MIENRKDLNENISSQESQSSIKLLVTSSRNISRRENKVKKFNCKKASKEKIRRDNLHHVLAQHNQKVGTEEYVNSRSFCSATIIGNGKVDTMLHTMICQRKKSKFVLKEESFYLLQI